MQVPQTRAQPPLGGNGFHDKSVGEILRDLSHDTATLVRQESDLFRTEMNARVETVQRTAGVMSVGVVILFFGAGALTAAIIVGLAQIMSAWVAALIVGLAYLAIGGVALVLGKQRLSEESFTPKETQRSVRRDIRAVREAAR